MRVPYPVLLGAPAVLVLVLVLEDCADAGPDTPEVELFVGVGELEFEVVATELVEAAESDASVAVAPA